MAPAKGDGENSGLTALKKSMMLRMQDKGSVCEPLHLSPLNLSEELVKIIKTEKSINIDVFYDRMNIPKKLRTDFGTAAIIKGALDICEKDGLTIGIIK